MPKVQGFGTHMHMLTHECTYRNIHAYTHYRQTHMYTQTHTFGNLNYKFTFKPLTAF